MKVPLKTTRAHLARIDGEWSVAIRPGVPDANFLIAHELGHYAIREIDGRPQHGEDEADAVAAHLIAPALVVEKLHGVFGDQVTPIAKALDITETCAVLRIGTVRGEERAVVAPGHVRAISFGGFASSPEPVLRALAAKPSKDLKKLRLHGSYDKGRIALRAS